ncbi:MAG: hypothetical protein WD509_01765 [Candidatus Paceibacterota bacterium]
MTKEEIEKNVFRSGVDDTHALLEQYKIFVDSADKISDRRLKTNEFFLGLNTAFLALLGLAKSQVVEEEISVIITLAALGGIAISYLWFHLIRSHKNLNGAKFKVVHVIEKRLPLSPYHAEWEIVGGGNDKKRYWPFSHIELIMPWIFVAIFVTILITKLLHLFVV